MPIVFAVLVVVVLFVLLRKLRGPSAAPRPVRGGQAQRHNPVAPDDNPEFLSELARRMHRRDQGEDF